jgi:hypothetical protein
VVSRQPQRAAATRTGRRRSRSGSSRGSDRGSAVAAAATHGLKVQHQRVPHELQALPLVRLQALQ